MTVPQALPMQTIQQPETRLPRWLWWALAALLFAAGLGIRLYDLQDPPLDFHPTRQLHSALIARGMYYENLTTAEEEPRSMAVQQLRMEGQIEPQVFERITAWSYQAAGGVYLWIPRLYAILFWMAAAVFLFLLAIDMVGADGALMVLLFFLIWPYGVVASRAFQPEPVMILLMCAALWALLRWLRRPNWALALSAGLLAGLAIYIKSVALFFLVPAFVVAILVGLGLRRALRSPQVWAMGLLAALPYVVYLIDGVLLSKSLVGQFSLRFFPEMWPDPAFYLRWISNLSRAIPFELCLLSALGLLTLRRPLDRAVLLAMWLGYVLYGMSLPHHISTHDYYHLPLYPLVGLGLGAVAQQVISGVRGPAWLARLVVTAVLLAALVNIGYEARNLLKRSDYRQQAQNWQEIGQRLGPGAAVVILSPDYGTGLAYWGWIAPTNWPTADEIQWRAGIGQESEFKSRFLSLAASRAYFVISPVSELDAQPDLKAYLESHYALLDQGADYLVYDLRASRANP